MMIAAIAGCAVAAVAQDAFDAHVSDIQILQLKEIQTELKVTDAQRTAMNRHAETHRKKIQAYMERLQKEKKDPNTLPQPDPQLVKFFNELKNSVVQEMQPGQLKRLREISLQSAGVAALMDDQVAAKAGVSQAQVKRLRDMFQAGAKRAVEIEQKAVQDALKEFENKRPANEAEAKKLQEQVDKKLQAVAQRIRPQVEKIRDETRTRMEGVLTDPQKRTWAQLQGAPFRPK
jgi:hypothetical protein